MSERVQKIIASVERMDYQEQLRMLGRLMGRMSLLGRERYVGDDAVSATAAHLKLAFQWHNEVLHTASNQMNSLLAGEDGYPADVLVGCLIEAASSSISKNLMLQMLEHAVKNASRPQAPID